MTAILHAHPRCDTCRKARRWLDDHGVTHDVVDLTVRAPTLDELRSLHRRSGLPLRKLLNTAGQSYRAAGLAQRIRTMDDEAILAALASDGMLVRRPIFSRDALVLVGFSPDAYARALT